ncbi:UDP-MurNAc hydroxylase [Phytomonospora endophytica]|uniref:UDP-MurNAc hydroxylase n=1 Tax=Phytomonospora endophytica TaxID=714109 RepID=A0A841FHF2_9ACTN|nr:UDP-MurNAc hydroxylase [Phytomonospora endophytica]GIG66334.1 iron-sulfur cluster-binding protein, RIESKE family [Phytomonospora endophytica]
MRITGTGHASMFIETAAGSILTDPWVNPAYFASWFPFPDNSQLDWDTLGQCDYLYVSHLHRDHFDEKNLRERISKKTTILLPEYPTSELEDELRELGFRNFIKTVSGEVTELDGGVKVMIQALTSPTDGPIGDSSLWIEDADGIRLLNQNDARPTDLSAFTRLGHIHAHLLQFSGAIWYPMVYELPDSAKRAFGKQKRDRQMDRSLRYIDDAKASWIFPIAGPPCFLDDSLWQFNDIHGDEGNIFPDQQVYLDYLADNGRDNGVILLPGTVSEVTENDCVTTHPVADVREFFDNKEQHLVEYRERQRPVIEAAKKSWEHPEIDVLAELKARFEPLMAEAEIMSEGINGPVRFDLTAPDDPDTVVQSVLFDFPTGEIRAADGEKVRYRFKTERRLVEHLLHIDEIDWVNSLFLSCRFSAARIGQYNEFVYTFFKCLSEERLNYAEGWFSERDDGGEDIALDGWTVQRRCPHLKADLTRFGKVEDGVLTCQMHGWKWNLATGRCLTSVGNDIRSAKRGE